jgi:hypothetical protein
LEENSFQSGASRSLKTTHKDMKDAGAIIYSASLAMLGFGPNVTETLVVLGTYGGADNAHPSG